MDPDSLVPDKQEDTDVVSTKSRVATFESGPEPEPVEEDSAMKAKVAMFEPPPPPVESETKAKAALFEPKQKKGNLAKPASSTLKKTSVMKVADAQNVTKLRAGDLSATLDKTLKLQHQQQQKVPQARKAPFQAATSQEPETEGHNEDPDEVRDFPDDVEDFDDPADATAQSKVAKFENDTDEPEETALTSAGQRKKLSVLKVSEGKKVTNLMNNFSASLEQALAKQKEMPKGTSTRREEDDEEIDEKVYIQQAQYAEPEQAEPQTQDYEEAQNPVEEDLHDVQLEEVEVAPQESEPAPAAQEPKPQPKKKFFCCF